MLLVIVKETGWRREDLCGRMINTNPEGLERSREKIMKRSGELLFQSKARKGKWVRKEGNCLYERTIEAQTLIIK